MISERGSRLRWRAVRTTLASTCWVSAPRRVRLPPQTLRVTTAGRMACSARQLVASIDGSHKKRNTAGNSLAKCLAKRSAAANGGAVSISRPSRAASRPRADARPCSLISPAFERSRRAEAVPQDRLHRARPRAVGMSGLQVLAPSQEVGQARLMRRLLEAAIGHPPVPHQHAGEVGAEKPPPASANPRPSQMA